MGKLRCISKILFLIILLQFIFISCNNSNKNYENWQTYNGVNEGIKYSSLTQIDTNTVTKLEVAWQYHTGDADTVHHSQIQCNPIVIDGTMYGVSAQMKLFAINAETGKNIWTFDPNVVSGMEGSEIQHILINSRGIAYWSDGKEDKRIFFTAGSNTFAVDAKTGKPIQNFANKGSIDLHKGLGREVDDLFVVNTSPGMVYKDLLILGTRVDENLPAAPGHVRAYDVRTGIQKWIFHTIPQPGEYGFDTWEDPNAHKIIGGVNVWSGFSLDEKRGLLFAGTGSASYDFYGGKRRGSNLYANCVLALDANTGKRVWHYQLIHHDLWDKDCPTPPVLITLNKNGKKIDAVAQSTKNGMVYVFERETGKPVYEITEVQVDTVSDLAGEKVWPTQPIPSLPAPFVRQTISLNDINPHLPKASYNKLKKEMQGYRFGNMYLPPGTKPSIVLPGYDGGGEWGGPAFDPETGLLYVNANEMAWVMQVLENKSNVPKSENLLQAGKRLYTQNCATCHSENRKGAGNNPALIGVEKKYNKTNVLALINAGRRMMPAFKHLPDEDKSAIATYILSLKTEYATAYLSKKTKEDHLMPYKMIGYNKFQSIEGMPGISPPWGTLNAINLNTGALQWKVPLGEYEELKKKGIPPTGTENYGGPVVTAGGLVFIAAASDGYIRAFNKTSGKILWQHKLPAPGFATPAVYNLKGKQYLVIACGGGKLGKNSSDTYMAFALPK